MKKDLIHDSGNTNAKSANSDQLAVKEIDNVIFSESLMGAAFRIIYQILIPAAKNPDGFTKFTRIEKQLPTNKSVLLTAEDILLLTKEMLGIEITKQEVETILDIAFHSGMLTGRWQNGKAKNYRICLFQQFDNEI